MKTPLPFAVCIPLLVAGLFLVMTIPCAFAASMPMDTCVENESCITATPLGMLIPEEPYLCIEGCNAGAAVSEISACMMWSMPTVWYAFTVEPGTERLNMRITSEALMNMRIALFRPLPDCENLLQVPLGYSGVYCQSGSEGFLEVLGTQVTAYPGPYYLAVASYEPAGGDFTLCLQATNFGYAPCTIQRDIVVISRTEEGPLQGPFEAGEELRVCMGVLNFSGAGNGCQWFQGLVPVFGDGWDPSSFDSLGQPLNATLNGLPFGEAGNGLYGGSTWIWDNEVGYHYDDVYRVVGDFDLNDRLDICHLVLSEDCPVGAPFLMGGCCGPCWDGPTGTILPGGWFAYGINGTCPLPGPPVRVDWGDGNSCGTGMGPWDFCFDIKIRPTLDPDNPEDVSSLEMTFFTFSDGEVGSWTGASKVCHEDGPTTWRPQLRRNAAIHLGDDVHADICPTDSLDYLLSHPDVSDWTWSVYPPGIMLDAPVPEPDGLRFRSTSLSEGDRAYPVLYRFEGVGHSGERYTKSLTFGIRQNPQVEMPPAGQICLGNKYPVVIEPNFILGGSGPYAFAWNRSGVVTPGLELAPPFQSGQHILLVTDAFGCTGQGAIELTVVPCPTDFPDGPDESNETPIPRDPPLSDGNFSVPQVTVRSDTGPERSSLHIFPVPAADAVSVGWPSVEEPVVQVVVLHPGQGVVRMVGLTETAHLQKMTRLDIRDLAAGVYAVILQTETRTLSGRLVKL